MLKPHIEVLYKVEPPLTPVEEGYGYWGVPLYDTKKDKIQCHVCGKWFKFLLSHVRQAHKLSPKEYRVRFGLSMRLPLVARSLSASHRKREERRWARGSRPTGQKGKWSKTRRRRHKESCRYGKNNALYLNKKGICKEQLKRRLLVVADTLGKLDFTYKELEKEDPIAYIAIRKRFRGLNAFRREVGWPTARENKNYSEESLIAAMRNKHRELGRIPKKKDFSTGRPKGHDFLRMFGSWTRAVVTCLGLDSYPRSEWNK